MTMTTLASEERRRGDLREILKELATAGWRHTLQRGPGTTRYGLPEHLHRWDRGDAYIEVEYDREGPLDYLRYEPTPSDDFTGILVGTGWIDTASLTGLFIRAASEGIFEPLAAAEPVAKLRAA